MPTYTCEFCTKTFKQRCTLLRHQQKAQYCLDIRSKKARLVIEESRISCEFCKQKFTRISNLKRHQDSCYKKIEYIQSTKISALQDEVDKLKKALVLKEESLIAMQHELNRLQYVDQQLLEKKLEVEKLQKVINKIAMKPRTVTTNQQIINLQPITQQQLNDLSNNFRLEHFKRGMVGVVDYALEHPLSNSLLCNDQSRKQFTWRDGDNENAVVSDPKLFHLTQKLCNSIQDRSRALASEAIGEITEECNRKIDEYTESGEEYLAEVHREKMFRMVDTYDKYCKNIQNLGNGEINDAINEFSNIMAIKILKCE